MKLAIIIMLISLLMSVVTDLYNLYDMNKRLRRLEISLAGIQLRLATGKNNAIESFTKVVAEMGGKMEDNLTLKDKLEKVQELVRRRERLEIFLDNPDRILESRASGYTPVYTEPIYLETEEEGLNEYIDEYFKKELKKVEKKLNELLK